MNLLADLSGGGYVSLAKIIFMILMMAPWLLAAPWVNKDSVKLRSNQTLWSLVAVGSGAAGMALWLVLPYIIGLLVYVVLVGAALGAYVVYRNGKVPDSHKVLTSEHLSRIFKHEKAPQIQVETRVKVYSASGKIVMPPAPDAAEDEINTYNLAQQILHEIVYFRASEADISPAGQQTRVRFVIDGVVSDRPPLDIPQSEAVVQYLKPLAGMNADERRRPQQGKLSVDLVGAPVDLMVISAGTTGGQRIQFKIVQEFVQTNLDLLGMNSDVLADIKAAAQSRGGVLLVSGKSGSGVTSTLYSILKSQDAYVRQLMTLEAKPVIELENVTQNAYGSADKLAGTLAGVLRRDPDLLMIDRVEDEQSAQMIAEAADRKMFILGVQAGDSFSALGKWVKLCADASAAVANLKGVLCQVLVRKLCPTCREAYRPDPQFLAKANLPAQKIDNFYRPPTRPLVDEKGEPYTCPTCKGNGYLGRTAVFEFLRLTDDLRALVASGAGLTQIQAACRKSKMLYLQEQALRKVIEGVTSVQEVIRVTQAKK